MGNAKFWGMTTVKFPHFSRFSSLVASGHPVNINAAWYCDQIEASGAFERAGFASFARFVLLYK